MNASSSAARAASGSLSHCPRATWRPSRSATSRCCAPSWRSRVRRRRSASPVSTMRARDARSASTCARSSTSSRPFSSASAAAPAASRSSSGLSHRRRSWISAPAGDGRGHPRLAGPGQHQRPAAEVDVPSPVGHAVGDRQRRVAERVAQRRLRRPGVSREPVDQARDRRGAEEAAPHQAREERERQQGERGQEEHLRDPGAHVELLRGVGDRAERHDHRAEPEHRREAAPLRPRLAARQRWATTHERARDHHELGQRLGGREDGGDVGLARDPQQVARAGAAGAVVVEPEQQRRQLQQRRDDVAGADHEPLGHRLEAARRERQQEVHEHGQDERVGQHAHQPRQRGV